jgi:pectin methylesterase-like acyl-CoA thioesterase
MVKQVYLFTINLLERMHCQFLKVIKNELDSIDVMDINNVQALILYNTGDRRRINPVGLLFGL